MDKDEYLEQLIFKGLTNLNNGFDAEGIKYFSADDFRIILRRVEELGVGVLGIEPWKNGDFYDVRGCKDYESAPSDSHWYWTAFEAFNKEDEALVYSATFDVPTRMLFNVNL